MSTNPEAHAQGHGTRRELVLQSLAATTTHAVFEGINANGAKIRDSYTVLKAPMTRY